MRLHGQTFLRLTLTESSNGREVRDFIRTRRGHGEHADVRPIDAVHWRKGCSPLGFLSYAGLVRIDEPEGKHSLEFVTRKDAIEAATPPAIGAEMPADPTERFVPCQPPRVDGGKRLCWIRAGRLNAETQDRALFVPEQRRASSRNPGSTQVGANGGSDAYVTVNVRLVSQLAG